MKKKTTKQVRGIDRIIKFQIDDGIESLTISGKEALADVSIDNKSNVTLYLYADEDKLNEIQSSVPFISIKTAKGGTEPDKTKKVTLSQDLTNLALEISENSKDLATFIKSKSSIELDLNGLIQKLLEIAGKLAELEKKTQEHEERLNNIEKEMKVKRNGLRVFNILNQELEVVQLETETHIILKFIQKGNGYGNMAIIDGNTYKGGGSNFLTNFTKGFRLTHPVESTHLNIPLINNEGYPLLVLDVKENLVSLSPYSNHSNGGIISNAEFVLRKKVPQPEGSVVYG